MGGLGEKWGWSKIAQNLIKRGVGGGRRPKSVSFLIFLDSMDNLLSFDVYYSPRDPLVAEPEFL